MAFHVVILSGGVGARLWPVSRTQLPKQFAPLMGGSSLFSTTCTRAAALNPSSLIAVTAMDQAALCRQHGPLTGTFTIKAEPMGRNTLPAIIWGTAGVEDDDVVLVLPSDHLINDLDGFCRTAEAAVALAKQGLIVTFGIEPDHPATGYGYIEAGTPLDHGAFRVNRFVEKPDTAGAQAMLDRGGYTWNSGMFCFTRATLRAEVRRLQPAYDGLFDLGDTAPLDAFESISPLSFDYGIAEHSQRMAVLPAAFDWSDLGSWYAVWEQVRDKQKGIGGNKDLKLIEENCRDLLIYTDRGNSKLYAATGVDNLAVVDTADALLIAPLDRAQEVRALREQAARLAPASVNQPAKEIRPWGSFEILLEQSGYKVKRLLVQPGKRLSLQRHKHRHEQWVVVRGTASVVRGEHHFDLEVGMATDIPVGTRHRLANLGIEELEVIEVQTGAYLGEDDIERFEDDFNRIPTSKALDPAAS